jgi:arylsulfatase A-like enzyme
VDLYATILDYAGAHAPERAGRSLRPLVEAGPDGEAAWDRAALFGAAYGRTAGDPPRPERDVFGLYARDERWKYMLFVQDVPAGMWEITRAMPLGRHDRIRGEENLYDLASDPYELVDLSADPAQRARMDRMRTELLTWWKETDGDALDLP